MNGEQSARAFLRRWWTGCVVATVFAAAGVTGAYAVAARRVADIPKVEMDAAVLEPGGNYLLIGSDSRAFVDDPNDAQAFGSAQAQAGQRSDTIMVAHVDGRRGTGLLVSFPRDLWVDVPGIGRAKLNAAFNAGPQRVVETIRDAFDIPISHYLQVDFAGFRNIVDAIGSVPIYFPAPARDVKTGLSVEQAGCQRLNGERALAYVRSRSYESLENGRWQVDPTADLGRITRQQYFLRTLAQEVVRVSRRVPWRAPDIVDAMLANMQRDPTLDLGALRALAYGFYGGGPRVETVTLPTRPLFVDGQSALDLDDAEAAPILARLRERDGASGVEVPEGVEPGDVRVAVRNGSGRAGAGGATLEALRAAGFTVLAPATNADRSDYATTELRYAAGAEKKAALVRAHLGGAGTIVALDEPAGGADVVVVVGRDAPRVAAPGPPSQPRTEPRATRPAPGSTAGASGGEPALRAAGC